MKELEKGFDIIKEHKDLSDFSGSRDEYMIESAESTLELKFPLTYKEFLKKLGCGDFAGEEIYGLTTDSDFENSGIPNAVWLTLQERKYIPKSLIIISELGDGTLYCLDTSHVNETGECPVVVWDPHTYEPGCKLEIEASDFGTFFLEKIQEALEIWFEKDDDDFEECED